MNRSRIMLWILETIGKKRDKIMVQYSKKMRDLSGLIEYMSGLDEDFCNQYNEIVSQKQDELYLILKKYDKVSNWFMFISRRTSMIKCDKKGNIRKKDLKQLHLWEE